MVVAPLTPGVHSPNSASPGQGCVQQGWLPWEPHTHSRTDARGGSTRQNHSTHTQRGRGSVLTSGLRQRERHASAHPAHGGGVTLLPQSPRNWMPFLPVKTWPPLLVTQRQKSNLTPPNLTPGTGGHSALASVSVVLPLNSRNFCFSFLK